ncbi:MAG: hypothetical protein IKU42_01845 [Oscillospiraceae bacterium]|nr:hypothetical protein [Oscillospiraceae bacterium]
MKVLVITRNAWDDTNSIGNTLSNFFTGVDNIEFANIYFRESSPNNSICKKYYKATEIEILKKWFFPHKIGTSFILNNETKAKKQSFSQKNEKLIVRFVRRHGVKIAYKISENIWYSERWINKNFREFTESFNPDLIFTFVKSSPQYYLTIKFLKETFKTPIFTWIADDEYTDLLENGSKKEISNLKYIIENSDYISGCSEKICFYYNSIFGCNAVPFYKSCDLSTPVKSYVNDPIKFVYAGNLLYGRIDIIKKISDILERCNSKNSKVLFEIYSNTDISLNEKKYFEQKNHSKYMGCCDYKSVKKRLSNADVVLHVESFEEKQIQKTRYSFSTKIIDCLQSGNVFLAVGPENIASIEYLKKIPGSYVINDIENLEENLNNILNNYKDFPERALSIRKFAEEYHNSKNNITIIEEIIHGITGE